MAPRYLNVSDLPAARASAERARPASRALEVSPAAADGKRGRRGEGSYSITSTPEAHSADMGRRMVVYGVQMLLRVLCLIAFVLVDHWLLRIVCGLGIIVLPWSAVLLANVGADRSERSSSYLGPESGPAPAQLSSAPASADGQHPEETIEGEPVDEHGRPLGPEPTTPQDAASAGMRDNGSDPRAA